MKILDVVVAILAAIAIIIYIIEFLLDNDAIIDSAKTLQFREIFVNYFFMVGLSLSQLISLIFAFYYNARGVPFWKNYREINFTSTSIFLSILALAGVFSPSLVAAIPEQRLLCLLLSTVCLCAFILSLEDRMHFNFRRKLSALMRDKDTD